MTHQTIQLDIPDDLYNELKQRAEKVQLPLEVELLNLTAAMLALNNASKPVNAFLRRIEGLSRTLRIELHQSMLAVNSAHDFTQALEKLAGALSRQLGDQQLLDTLAIQSAAGEKRHALDILDEMPGHLALQTAEEVDRYVREERASWED